MISNGTSAGMAGDGEADGVQGATGVGNAMDSVMTLALGGRTTFWQCRSGGFYNLYTENWAAQCSPVELRVTRLVECD